MPWSCKGMPKFSHLTVGTLGGKSELGHVQLTAWGGGKVFLVPPAASAPVQFCYVKVLAHLPVL